MDAPTVQPTARFDLEMYLWAQGDQGLRGSWSTARTCSKRRPLSGWSGTSRHCWRGSWRTRTRAIAQLPLSPAAERRQLLLEWNDTARDYPRHRCLHQLFEEQVQRTPDAVAVVFGEQQLTYRELNARANQLARHLRGLGVGPEVLVGICVERSLEMVIGLLGILKAGGAICRWTRRRRRNAWRSCWPTAGCGSC